MVKLENFQNFNRRSKGQRFSNKQKKKKKKKKTVKKKNKQKKP